MEHYLLCQSQRAGSRGPLLHRPGHGASWPARRWNNETLVRIVSTRTVTIGGRTMTNHNKLLSHMDGCIGLKTGYTQAAGRTLVSCAEQERPAAGGGDTAGRQRLGGPRRLCMTTVFPPIQPSWVATLGQTMPAGPGGTTAVQCVRCPWWRRTASPGRWRRGSPWSWTWSWTDHLRAPIRAGRRAGEAVFSVNGQEVGRVDAAVWRRRGARGWRAPWSILKQGLPG